MNTFLIYNFIEFVGLSKRAIKLIPKYQKKFRIEGVKQIIKTIKPGKYQFYYDIYDTKAGFLDMSSTYVLLCCVMPLRVSVKN